MTTPTIDSSLSGQTTGTIKIPDYYALLSSIADSLVTLASKAPDTVLAIGDITGPVFTSLDELVGVTPGYFVSGDGVPAGTYVVSTDSLLLNYTYTTNAWIPPIRLTSIRSVSELGEFTCTPLSPLNPLLPGAVVTVTGTSDNTIIGYTPGKSYVVGSTDGSETFTLLETKGLDLVPVVTTVSPVSMTFTPEFVTRTVTFVNPTVYIASMLGSIQNTVVNTGVKAYDPYDLIGKASMYAYFAKDDNGQKQELADMITNLPNTSNAALDQIKTLLSGVTKL